MSTSWNVHRNGSLGAVLQAISDLGFQRVELNSLTPAMAHELEPELARQEMAVQSVHNPCPWPVDGDGAPLDWALVDCLSAPDDEQRRRALAWARETVELAGAVGARAVIVHLGGVPTTVPQRELFQLLAAGRQEELAARLAQALAERQARHTPYLRNALASIRELGECAARAGVALGVESRDGYMEIPSLAEFEKVFAVTEGLPVLYWHDVGHVEKQTLLGLAAPGEYLRRLGPRLLGVHLHDAILDRDHFAPGQGQIDLAAAARLLPDGALRTLELSDVPTVEEVERGVQLLRGLGLA